MLPAMAMTRMLVRAAITITEFNENTMMNDVRRIIVSKEVAAQIREEYGEDITITTPDWKDTATKTSWTTRFCFIDVTAEDPDLALKVADEVANKVCDIAKETVPLSQVEVFDSAALKATDNSNANEWGTADLEVKGLCRVGCLRASA